MGPGTGYRRRGGETRFHCDPDPVSLLACFLPVLAVACISIQRRRSPDVAVPKTPRSSADDRSPGNTACPPCGTRRRLCRRRPHALRQGQARRPVRTDACRRPDREGGARAAAAPPRAPPGADRRGRHRRHHPAGRPGAHARPHRRHARRPPPVRAGLRDRPHVRRRDDRCHHHGSRHRHGRRRRRHRRRSRAHGPPPDGLRRRRQPSLRGREARGPAVAEHGRHRGEPARQVPAADQGARRPVRRRVAGQVREGPGQRQHRARPGAGGGPFHRAGLGPGHRRRAARAPRRPSSPSRASRRRSAWAAGSPPRRRPR